MRAAFQRARVKVSQGFFYSAQPVSKNQNGYIISRRNEWNGVTRHVTLCMRFTSCGDVGHDMVVNSISTSAPILQRHAIVLLLISLLINNNIFNCIDGLEPNPPFWNGCIRLTIQKVVKDHRSEKPVWHRATVDHQIQQIHTPSGNTCLSSRLSSSRKRNLILYAFHIHIRYGI